MTPDERGRRLAARFEAMSPEAQRLLCEQSRWWPMGDGSISIRVTAEADERDALLEFAQVLREEFGVEIQDSASDSASECRGPGLTFEELRRRRSSSGTS